mgnify:CR=1 FL=1
MDRKTKEPNIYGKSDLTYNSYLKVAELLKLQVPESDPPHHDELLFIIIHQAYELWFKLILHELDSAMSYMREGKVLRAQHFVKRVVEIMKVLVRQIHILETMTPAEFLEFRDKLNPASGFQSLQFREVEFVAGLRDERYLVHFQNRPEMLEALKKRLSQESLKDVYYSMLKKLGYEVPAHASQVEDKEGSAEREKVLNALKKIYQKPEADLPLYLLSESLLEFDEYLTLWRIHHVQVVARTIGFKQGTGGSAGVEYLQKTTMKRCFPLLWEVRTYLEKT